LCSVCYANVGGALSPCPTCTTPLGSIRSRVLERLRDKKMQRRNAAWQERGAGSHKGAESAGETANAAPSAHSKVADVSAHERAADMQMQEKAANRSGADAALQVHLTIQSNIAAVAAAVAAASAAGDTASSEEEDLADARSEVRELCSEELAELVRSSRRTRVHLFVMFYTVTSKDCRRFMHVWNELHRRLASNRSVLIAMFNCDADQARALRTYGLKRFPTLQWYRPGAGHGQELQAGLRAHLESLLQWVHACTSEEESECEEQVPPLAPPPLAPPPLAPPPNVPRLKLGPLGPADARDKPPCSSDRPPCSSERARISSMSRRAQLRANASRHADPDVRAAILKARLGKRSALAALLASDSSLLFRAQDPAGPSSVCVCQGRGVGGRVVGWWACWVSVGVGVGVWWSGR